MLSQLTSLHEKVDTISDRVCTVVNLFEGSEWKSNFECNKRSKSKREAAKEAGRVRLKSENQFEAVLELFKILVDLSTKKKGNKEE